MSLYKSLQELKDFFNLQTLEYRDIDGDIIFHIKTTTEFLKSMVYKQVLSVFQNALFYQILHNTDSEHEIISCKHNKSIEDIISEINDKISENVQVDIEFYINKLNLIELIKNELQLSDEYKISIFLNLDYIFKSTFSKGMRWLEEEVYSLSKKALIFIFDEDVFLENNYSIYCGFNNIQRVKLLSRNYVRPDSSITNEIIQKRQELCNWVNPSKYLTPDYVNYSFSSGNFILPKTNYVSTFDAIKVKLILSFISNYTSSNDLDSIINGYRQIKIEHPTEDFNKSDENNWLYKLYVWTYESKTIDKMGILRNLISLYLCDECERNSLSLLLNKAYDIMKSSISNLNIYLQKNIERYFDTRKKIGEFVSTYYNKIREQVNSLTQTTSRNGLATIGFIIVTSLGYYSQNVKPAFITWAVILYGVYYLLTSSVTLIQSMVSKNDIVMEHNDLVNYYSSILDKNDLEISPTNIQKAESRFIINWVFSLFIHVAILGGMLIIILYRDKFCAYIDSMKPLN